ncbi:hypothetical protein GQ55_2G095000 [Panicum hallii var. hallii]|uniref:Uncharacterized protein n=1 Tax=Panicum hallii var. hallii TaxID=1504633 RepID=A0A2T7EN75_9POAL|nr:hypothetical protein GQ55_2G095000 [Panicum hallii var. hallii]
MVNFEKLCDVYASDLAKGGNAKGPGEQEVAEDEPFPNEAHMNSEPAGGVHEQTKDDNSTSSSGKQGRKRVYADSDGLETGLLNMSNSFAKYLESEKKNANTMADIGKNPPRLDDDQVVMAVRIIGRDPEDSDLFLQMEDRYKVIFVKQELEAAKNKLKDA